MTDLELLGQLEAIVRAYVEKVSLRGEGCASFLLIESGGRSIEASRHEGKWWLEFWNRGQEYAARELTLESNEGALLAIRDWVK
jgi:hypothetical protein